MLSYQEKLATRHNKACKMACVPELLTVSDTVYSVDW